jgi:SurA-like N-terminal domain
MKTLAAGAISLALLAGCGGGGSNTVATVGGDEITAKQLDALVAHFRAEAKLEGKSFPQEGGAEFDKLRNQLLGLLVYRTELEQAAERLGVTVKESEVARRLPAGEKEGDARRHLCPRHRREPDPPRAALRESHAGRDERERTQRQVGRVPGAAPARDEGALRARLRAGLVALPRSRQTLPPAAAPTCSRSRHPG